MRRLMTFGIVAQACVLACGCADKKNPTDKKKAWDGAKALSCAGADEVRLEGKEIRATRMDIQGDCRVTLIKCTWTQNISVSIGKHGYLSVKGGVFKGRSGSLGLGDTARADLSGIIVHGSMSIRVGDRAILKVSKSKLRGDIWPSDDAQVSFDEVQIRKGSFHVRKRAQVTLRRTNLVQKGSNGMYLSGKAVVTLLDSSIRGYKAIDARDDVRVRIQGGRMTGKEIAISASGRAMVGYKSATLEGKVTTGGKALVLQGWSADPADPAFKRILAFQAVRAKYDRRACRGVSACLRDHGTQRFVVGRIDARVAKDGTITFEKAILGRRTKGKVRECLRKLYDNVRIANFEGPAGRLLCEYRWILDKKKGGYRGRTKSRFIPTGSSLSSSRGALPDAADAPSAGMEARGTK